VSGQSRSDAGAAACPCGSGEPAAECCNPVIAGAPAASPLALMRSRYTAFVREDADYLLRSWHPDYRPESVDFPADTQWTQLLILDHASDGTAGSVHFIARFREGREWFELEERSRFQHEQGHWFYLAGDADFRPLNPGRNDACPCGSGRKWKKCCG